MRILSFNTVKMQKKFPSLPVILCLILNSFVISYSEGKPAKDIAEEAFPSVVMLVMLDSHDQPTSLGSGFFVRENVIATNLHVIEGAASGYAKIIGKKEKYDITGLVVVDQQRDLVLLKVQDANAPILVLSDNNDVSIGDEIYAIGNPQGLEGTFSKGIVSSFRKVDKSIILQITAPISPGSSGGPILDTEGKVIGVSFATFNSGQNLNFAIPVLYLRSLLSFKKPITPFPARSGTGEKIPHISEIFGTKNTDGVIGTQLTWKYPVLSSLNEVVMSMSGEYSFSLRNKLRYPVKGVICLIVFFDRDGEPIDTDIIEYRGTIPPNLARRVTSSVDKSIPELTTPGGGSIPKTKVEFRMLDFQIVKSEELF